MNNIEKTTKIKVTYSSTNEKCIEDVIKNLIISHIDETSEYTDIDNQDLTNPYALA